MIVTCLSLVVAFLFSSIITFFVAPLFRALAFKTGILDIPDGILKNHERPVAYLGGVAVFLGFIIPVYFFRTYVLELNVHYFLVGLIILLIVGLIDDIYAISPLKKFLGEVCACLFFFKDGLFFKEQFFFDVLPCSLQPLVSISLLNIFFSSWWMLTVINAINLIDIMDGLAVAISFVAAVSFCVMAIVSKKYLLAVVMSSLCGSLVAFFCYNKPRASMYLGDAGSLFIGGVLAAAPFFLDWGSSSGGVILAPFFVLFVPLFEVVALIVIRSWKKIPFYYGSPHHFVSYFKKREYSVKKILTIAFTMGSLSGALGLFVAFKDKGFFPAFLIILGLMLLWGNFVYFYQNKSFFFKKCCFFFC